MVKIGKPIRSRISIAGHPLHPTMVHFPIALLLAAFASDVGFFYTTDPFWVRASLWLLGVGAIGGWVAGSVGLVELVISHPLRYLITAWNHAILAVLMLSLASFNWMIRYEHGTELLLPWGIYLSLLTSVLILLTSLLGGQLVYEHGVGVNVE